MYSTWKCLFQRIFFLTFVAVLQKLSKHAVICCLFFTLSGLPVVVHFLSF